MEAALIGLLGVLLGGLLTLFIHSKEAEAERMFRKEMEILRERMSVVREHHPRFYRYAKASLTKDFGASAQLDAISALQESGHALMLVCPPPISKLVIEIMELVIEMGIGPTQMPPPELAQAIEMRLVLLTQIIQDKFGLSDEATTTSEQLERFIAKHTGQLIEPSPDK